MNTIFVIYPDYPLFFIVYFTPKHSENNIIIDNCEFVEEMAF